ncbi:MAG: hypothetical protein A4E52_01825 [Pelotomaculum sp. PtaB.Bin013]|nr:MAG: hypothetical protein A4E52_01825 [Pelotomaculum sp. PtaB.Bin013]
MGLDVYLCDGENRVEENPSEKYPEHTCNKVYLRSAYNESGTNRVLRNLIGKDLYYIFEPGNEYEIPLSPEKINSCIVRAKEVLEEIKVAPPYRVLSEWHTFGAADNTEEAMQVFKEQLAQHKGSYSNSKGTFFLDKPIEVTGIIFGSHYGRPTTFLIFKSDISYYIQAVEIVIEFLEYALTLNNPVIYWSS